MLTRVQRLKIEQLIASCKTDEGVRIMSKLNDVREFNDVEYTNDEFDAWIHHCASRLKAEGL